MSLPFLTDEEIDGICAGLRQPAAMVRYLRTVVKVPVERKPNGRPLVRRTDWDRLNLQAQNDAPAEGPNWSRAA
ncbi:MAG TPA: hypothetical protein VGE36_00925 [Roseateles sp.]